MVMIFEQYLDKGKRNIFMQYIMQLRFWMMHNWIMPQLRKSYWPLCILY